MSSIKELKKKLRDVQEECEKYTKLYWGLFHKTKSGCDHYKDIINKKDLWIMELERKISIYEVKEYNGIITFVSQDNIFGSIECPDFENKITFHKNNCLNFILKKTKLIEKNISFNLDFTHGKFQAINVKLKENNIDKNYLDMVNDFMESPEIFDNIQYNIEEKKENYKINHLFENCDVWYMNGYNKNNMDDHLKIWDHLIDNGFVHTWGGYDGTKIINVNHQLPNKLKKNDKLAWYFPGRGYVSILEVADTPRLPTDDEIKITLHGGPGWSTLKEAKDSFTKYSWTMIVIPIKVLAKVDKDKCINKCDIEWDEKYEWSYGYRGSSSIKPTNEKWIDQVSMIYDKMLK